MFHDGAEWNAVINSSEQSDLRDISPMHDYSVDQQYQSFKGKAMLNYAVKFFVPLDSNSIDAPDVPPILSLVADAGSHATHVAGIIGGVDHSGHASR